MTKTKPRKAVRAWANVSADGKICNAFISSHRPALVLRASNSKRFLGRTLRVVRVEIHEVLPKKRKESGK